jgi:hypothetical protein
MCEPGSSFENPIIIEDNDEMACDPVKTPSIKKRKRKPPVSCPIDQKDIHVTPKTDAISFEDVSMWKAKLAKDGFVVVTGICTDSEINTMLNNWKSDLENLGTGIDLNRPETLTKPYLPGIANVGIFKDPSSGWGQSRTAWESRRLALPVFQCLWGSDKKLQTSFDTGSLFPNWNLPSLRKSKTASGWLHVDKGSFIDQESIQGLFTWLPADEKSGGLVVCPGTHNEHSNILDIQRKIDSKSNYIPLDWSIPGIVKIVESAGVHLVSAPAGSMILWNSTTIHANNPALVTSDSTSSVLRFANYVCMMPEHTNKETYELRSQAIEKGKSCNHWTFAFDKSKSKNKRYQGPLAFNNLPYPRHANFRSLNSVALSPETIRNDYPYMMDQALPK